MIFKSITSRILGEDTMDPVMKSVDIILLLNFLLFYVLMILLVKLQKKHPEKNFFTEKKFPLIFVSFSTFAIITTSIPLLISDFHIVIIDVILLVLLWTLTYWWMRWLVRKFSSKIK